MTDLFDLKDQWREEMSERRANNKETFTFDDWIMIQEAREMLWAELDSEL